jgi:hypothetical protein
MAKPVWVEQDPAQRGRYARKVTCRKCGQPAWSGLDNDLAAHHVLASPEVLDPASELASVLAGVATYALKSRAGRLVLIRRDHWQINGTPAGSPGRGGASFDVVAEHRCVEVA